MKTIKLKYLLIPLFSFFLIVLSCTKTDEEPTSDAETIELISNSSITGMVGSTLETPIEVLVKDQFGHAFAETVVHFTPSDGSVAPTVKTDARGIASVLWTLGENSGKQTLTISVFKTDGKIPLEGSPIIVTANAEGNAEASSIALVSGGGQSGQVNTTLNNPIQVKIKDAKGNPFAGATVHFATTDGSVSASSGVSDSNGNVSINWTLGSTVGTQIVTVTAFKADGTTPLNGSPLTITATGTQVPSFAAILQNISGDNQSGTVNQPLANPIVVRVLDQFENPFAGATVHFATTDGSVSASSGVSDSNGNVSINWTLGSSVGTQIVTVTAFKADGTTPLSGSPLTIFADAQVALEADILQEVSGNSQSGIINTALTNPIVVRVLDQFENPFAGVTVFFTPTNGSVSAQSVTTDSNGETQIIWTLGPEITDQLLTITAFKADGTTPLNGSPIAMFVSAKAPLAIGDFHAGGVVFYLDNTGEHGLVCAITDQASNAAWGCTGTAISGADGTAIGTGAQNTQDIIASCTESLIAAELCSSLNLNGFSDWFLPSQNELNELFANKAAIDATATGFGGTALQTNFYWSSTELNANQAWGYNVFGDDFKNNTYNVRVIRAF